MNKSASFAIAAIIVAIAGGAFYLSSSNAAKPSAAASSSAGAGAPAAGGGEWTSAAPASSADAGSSDVRRFRTPDGREFEWHANSDDLPVPAGNGMAEQRRAVINIDGHRVEFDPSDPASVDAAIAQAPADKRDQIRQALEKLQKDHPGPDLLGGDMHGNIQADATGAAAMMKDLIASGMSPEQAREVVAASLADSIQTRLARSGSNAKVKTELMSPTDGGEGRVGVMIMIDDDETTDLPAPADGATVETDNK